MLTNFFIGYNVYENTFKVYIKKKTLKTIEIM